MYQHTYAEVLADSAMNARSAERRALDSAVYRLTKAAETAPGSAEEEDALDFTARLWRVFIADLASPGNDLAPELRANLLSIGLGVMAEIQRTREGASRDLEGLAEICGILRDGLV